jgi:hypothetical protein
VLLDSILGSGDALTPRSPDLTPASSVPGTPSFGHSDLPGLTSLRASGRVSRISSAGSDRAGFGPTLVQSATDTIVDRCVRVRVEACMMYLEPLHRSPMTPRFIPDLIDIQQELFELPQRVCYFPYLVASLANARFISRSVSRTIRRFRLQTLNLTLALLPMKKSGSLSSASARPQWTRSGHWKGSKKKVRYWTAR